MEEVIIQRIDIGEIQHLTLPEQRMKVSEMKQYKQKIAEMYGVDKQDVNFTYKKTTK